MLDFLDAVLYYMYNSLMQENDENYECLPVK